MLSKYSGITIVEITIVSAIFILLTTAIIFIIKPNEYLQKARDTKRVKNISQLYEALNEYKFDNKTLPGDINTVYYSNVGANLQDSATGWFPGDITRYLNIKYIDPKNTDPYVYTYKHDGVDFELNCVLEIKSETMKNDKGNNIYKFEMGTNLDLLP